MGKPYCKMTLKELLEYLTSLSQDEIYPPKMNNQSRVAVHFAEFKPVPLVQIDEATFHQVLYWGGIPPCYYN